MTFCSQWGELEAAVTGSSADFQEQIEVMAFWVVSVAPAGHSWPQPDLVQPHSQATTWVKVRDLCWEKPALGRGLFPAGLPGVSRVQSSALYLSDPADLGGFGEQEAQKEKPHPRVGTVTAPSLLQRI